MLKLDKNMQSFDKQSKLNTVAQTGQSEAQIPLPESLGAKTSKKRMLHQITGGLQGSKPPTKGMKANYIPGKFDSKQQPSSLTGSKAKRAPFGEVFQVENQ